MKKSRRGGQSRHRQNRFRSIVLLYGRSGRGAFTVSIRVPSRLTTNTSGCSKCAGKRFILYHSICIKSSLIFYPTSWYIGVRFGMLYIISSYGAASKEFVFYFYKLSFQYDIRLYFPVLISPESQPHTHQVCRARVSK